MLIRFPISFVLFFILLGSPISRSQQASEPRLVTDLNPGSVGSYPSNFFTFAGHVYFSAYTQPTGFELFRFNGTNITLAADINDTVDDIGFGVREGNDSAPDDFATFNGALVMSAFEPRRGGELWSFNGSSPTRISDINQDANDSIKLLPKSSFPRELVVLNNTLYFSATSRTNPPDYELWQYDGATVRQAANLHPDSGSDYGSYPQGLTAFNSALYFMANNGSTGYELFRHDSTGTRQIELNLGGPESSSYPKFFTPFGPHLYFQAYTPEFGFELWRTDGTNAARVSDLAPANASSYPENLTVFNGALYFTATDSNSGFELWRYDGQTATRAADINTSGDGTPKNLFVFNNALFFSATDGSHGWELWKFDGATATMVSDLNTSGDSFPKDLTTHLGALYFTATTAETGYELFKYDGASITLAADVNPGPADSFPRSLHRFGNQLLFSAAANGSSDWELWVLETQASPNTPPSVTLTSPASGSIFQTNEPIHITADANDDGTITQVDFYANDILLGTDFAAPFTLTTNFAAGTYSLRARAYDNLGATQDSSTVGISVTAPASTQPHVDNIQVSGTNLTLSITAASGATITLERTSDFTTWEVVDTQISNGSPITFAQSVDTRLAFYRVRIN